MTDEQAIEVLKQLQKNFVMHTGIYIALTKAIKALENIIWLKKQVYGEVKHDD